MRAVAPFTLDRFDQAEPHDEHEGVALSRAEIAKTFTGDIEATSTVEMLAARGADGGAGYVAVERVVGTVHGRAGSFVLLHAGTMTPEDRWGPMADRARLGYGRANRHPRRGPHRDRRRGRPHLHPRLRTRPESQAAHLRRPRATASSHHSTPDLGPHARRG